MFTGIVEESGIVTEIQPGPKSIQLTVRSKICARDLHRGNSLAVNGCCLTVVGLKRPKPYAFVQFDLLRETWNRTNFKALKTGAAVNLERPLRADSRLGGHFVTGHIDGTGKITRWEKAGHDWILEVAPPREIKPFLIFKGSIAVDGISLTIADVLKKSFRIWIIPHTYEVTALQERKLGDEVNLEADLLGKYVRQFLSSYKRDAFTSPPRQK